MIEHRQSHLNNSVLDDRVAAEIMTPKVLTAESNWTTEQLALFFKEHKISGAPVTDAAGRLVGVVSLTDLVMQRFNSGGDHDECLQSVADIMTADVQDVTMNTPLHKVASLMVTRNIHRVMVTHDKKVVGIISSLDMLRQEVG